MNSPKFPFGNKRSPVTESQGFSNPKLSKYPCVNCGKIVKTNQFYYRDKKQWACIHCIEERTKEDQDPT